MNQMTIFEAIDDKPKKVGIRYRWHVVKRYEDLEVLVGTAIPGEDTVRFLPMKSNIGIQLDRETHDRAIAKGAQVFSDEEYREWLTENNFEERDVKSN